MQIRQYVLIFPISSRNKNEPCANRRFRHSSPRLRNGSSPAGWRAWKKEKRKKQYSSDSAEFFKIFLKSAGAWKGNNGVGHDGNINTWTLGGMTAASPCPVCPAGRNRNHRRGAYLIAGMLSASSHPTFLTPVQAYHLQRSEHPQIHPYTTLLFNFSMRDARCFALSFRIPFGT